MIEFLRHGDTRWRTVEREPGRYVRYSADAPPLTVVINCRVIVRVQERRTGTGNNGCWEVVYCDWENATPAPTAWERLRDWLTHPVRTVEPRAVARERWVIR